MINSSRPSIRVSVSDAHDGSGGACEEVVLEVFVGAEEGLGFATGGGPTGVDGFLAVVDAGFQCVLYLRRKGRGIERLAGFDANPFEALAQLCLAGMRRDTELEKKGHLAEEV